MWNISILRISTGIRYAYLCITHVYWDTFYLYLTYVYWDRLCVFVYHVCLLGYVIFVPLRMFILISFISSLRTLIGIRYAYLHITKGYIWCMCLWRELFSFSVAYMSDARTNRKERVHVVLWHVKRRSYAAVCHVTSCVRAHTWQDKDTHSALARVQTLFHYNIWHNPCVHAYCRTRVCTALWLVRGRSLANVSWISRQTRKGTCTQKGQRLQKRFVQCVCT